MPNKDGYFEEYWKQNGDKILQERRERYQNDPEYKDRVLKASRDYRARKKEDNIKMPRTPRTVSVTSGNGVPFHLFQVGALATYLSRSVQAVNHWEKQGILPPTPYRDTRGFRYYTKPMMDVVREVVGDKKRLFPVDPQMEVLIRQRWVELGVPMDVVGFEEAVAATIITASDEVESAEA